MKSDLIKETVNNFPTKYEQGFIHKEILEIIKMFPDVNMEKLNAAFDGNTAMLIEDQIITYHCDVETALRCGIENRDIKIGEWD